MTIGQPKPFGLRDVKVTDIAGAEQVDFPASRTLSVTPRFSSGELIGDDAIASVVSIIIGADWSLEGGGIPLDALAIITGKTATLDGVTPNQTLTLSLEAGDVMPYFKIYGKAVGEGLDDVHGKLGKCKVTSIEGSFASEEFIITSCSGIAVADDAGLIVDYVQNETATDLPTT